MALVPEEAVRTLEGMGFLRDDALEALKKYNNAVEPALEWLLVSKPSPSKATAHFLSSSKPPQTVVPGHVSHSIPLGHPGPPSSTAGHGIMSSPINIPAPSVGDAAMCSSFNPIIAGSLSARHMDSMQASRVSVSLEDERFTPLWHDERQLHMAIQKSLQDQEGRDLVTLEPIDPNKRKRENNLPVGLKNIGCTCYFNSLVQTYYMLPTFRNSILGLETNDMSSLSDSSPEFKALQFVYTLQQLFAFLKLSQKKYVDPSNVFNSLVAMHGTGVKPGTEQDPTEFNMLFMQSISDGLAAHSKLNSQATFSIPAVPVIPKKRAEESDLIKHLFLGSSFQTISAKEADDSTNQMTVAQQFNHIILDICYGDLYASLDAYTAPVQLKDYVTGKNFKTPLAYKTETFEKLPRLLTFQLQRVNYDLQRKEAVKLNNQFGFDKVIYLDRYMHRNEGETARRRERAVILQSEVNAMEEQVAKFERSDLGLTIQDQIANVAELMRTFAGNKIEHSDIARAALAALGDQVHSHTQDLKTQIMQKKKEMYNIFNDMRQHEYRLHAVLVHDGRAGSGHYWVYAQDPFSQSKWYLFDDAKVEEVTEQIVWDQSRGGGGQDGPTSSAYCLMYLHHSSSAPPVNGAISFHTITGFHPAIASLHPTTFQTSAKTVNDYTSPVLKTPNYIAKNNKPMEPNSITQAQTSPAPFASPFHPQTLLSTSPPLFSARNLLIDSPVLIPVSVKSRVDDDNRSFEDEVVQWDVRVIQEMDNAALAERINTCVSKYQAKLAACVNDRDGDPKLKSFAHYLLGINSQDLMQYVIAEECYAATFPPASHSPPSSPSLTFQRDRLEEDQGSEAIQKIEAGLGHVQLHLTFQQKATLSLLQKEYAQFAHVAELYIYAVHFLVDGWYREAVVALLLAVNHEHHKLMYSLAQNSRAGEIRRVLPLCVRRLSAQAAELLASAHGSTAHASSLRQALDMAKLVVIGSSVATELRSSASSSSQSSPASTVASPSLLHQVLNLSDTSTKAKVPDALESTQDLLSVWENVAANCTDSSVRGLCEEIIEICRSCKIRQLDKWLGGNTDNLLPQLQLPSSSSTQTPISLSPSPLPYNNIHTRHLHANQLLDAFLARHRAFMSPCIDK